MDAIAFGSIVRKGKSTMHHTLATRFNRRNARQISAREALSDDQLRQVVPSIFAEQAHDSRSERYVYVPTIQIVQGLRNEGWQPFFAVQAQPATVPALVTQSTCCGCVARIRSPTGKPPR